MTEPSPPPAPQRVEPPLLSGVTVEPGQTLVLAVKEATRPDQAAAIAEAVRAKLPGVEVLILAGIEQMAVYRP